MIAGIRHTGLVVADLDASLRFWCDVLGFNVVNLQEESGRHMDAMLGLRDVRVTTAKLAAPGGGMLELLRFHSHPDAPDWRGHPYSTGFTHIALTVVNLEDTFRQLSTHGVIFPASPQRSPDGNVKVIYARGPEGVLLELVENLSK